MSNDTIKEKSLTLTGLMLIADEIFDNDDWGRFYDSFSKEDFDKIESLNVEFSETYNGEDLIPVVAEMIKTVIEKE